MKIIFPAEHITVTEFDLVTDELFENGDYTSVWVFYGVDDGGHEWRWMEQHIQDIATETWIEDRFNVERIS